MKLGKQMARAVDCALSGAEGKTPCVAIEFANDENESITWYGYLSDKASKRTIADLRKMGWQGDDLSELTATDISKSVEIDVYNDPWTDNDGNTRESTKCRLAGMAAAPLGSEAAKALAAKLKGLCKSVPKPTKADAPF